MTSIQKLSLLPTATQQQPTNSDFKCDSPFPKVHRKEFCSICQQNEETWFVQTPCGHSFHQDWYYFSVIFDFLIYFFLKKFNY